MRLSIVVVATLAAVSGASGQAKTPPKGGNVTYIVAPTGNEARYRVREQLVGFDLPNDAVGATTDITGRIVLEPNGTVVKAGSKIVVQLSSLKSDKSRRDGYLQRRTLETSAFPSVELVPVSLQGVTVPMAPGTSKTFSMVGDLTIRGVTHPTTWQVTARADGGNVVGSATTAFTFTDFNLEQPRASVVLTVADTVKLEYDFHFVPDTVK